MKIAVFGAGAVGGHIAARLANSGTPVSVVARGPHLKAIRENGLILQADDETIVSRVNATDKAAELGPQDFTIVSLKGPALAGALGSIAPLVGPDTRVLFAMNGLPWWFGDGMPVIDTPGMRATLDPSGTLRTLVPMDRLIWVSVSSGGTIAEPGVIRNMTPAFNALTLGYPDGRREPGIERIAALFSKAGYRTTITDDIRNAVWFKLLVNASLSMVATVTERNVSQTVSDPETRALVIACMHEILAIGRAIGIEGEADPVAMTEPAKHGTHRSSFLQDFAAGRPVELATTILAARDIARATGVAAPHLTSVAALVAARSADRVRTAKGFREKE